MRKLIAVAGLLACMAGAAYAETTVGGSTFTVSALVVGINSLTADAKLIGTNAAQSSVTFASVSGVQGAWSKLTDQYIQVSVNDNAISWRLRAFTNNFSTGASNYTPSTTTWGANFGGLVSHAVPGAKVGMGWRNSAVLLSTGPTTGNPAILAQNGWTFLKDLKDQDDTATGASNESFASADGSGYANVAFGSPTFTRISTPFTGGSTTLASLATPWYLYTEGDFSSSPAATYSGSLVLELLNQ